MLRRNTRLRKEYLLRKSQEGAQREEHEKRQAVKTAIDNGTQIPYELRQEAAKIREQIDLDDPSLNKLHTHADDEYNKVGLYDPKILMTTSHEPSARLIQFLQELRLCFPGAQRINRGNTKIQELTEMCRSNDFTDLIIIHEHRGEPDGMIITHFPYGPTAFFTLSGCVLRHDIGQDLGSVSEAAPNLIFEAFTSKLGARVTSILQALFPIPKPDTRRVMSFINRDDIISFRHHVYKKNAVFQRDEKGNKKEDIELAEVGPRFEMKIYHIKLGTLEMKEAETEWVFKSHYARATRQNVL